MIMLLRKLRHDAIVPAYKSAMAAGFDLAIPEDIEIYPRETIRVPLGFAVAVPERCELQIRPRSGVSLKSDLVLANSPGTIDADYRGEVGPILYNKGPDLLKYERGERLAQGAVCPVFFADIVDVDALTQTRRGSGGFGSTGLQ